MHNIFFFRQVVLRAPLPRLALKTVLAKFRMGTSSISGEGGGSESHIPTINMHILEKLLSRVLLRSTKWGGFIVRPVQLLQCSFLHEKILINYSDQNS